MPTVPKRVAWSGALRADSVGVLPIFYTPHAYFPMHDRKNWKARFFNTAERWLGTSDFTWHGTPTNPN